MGRNDNVNVNVYLAKLKEKNVNVKQRRDVKIANEDRIVNRIVSKLGPISQKDEAYWHKVAKTLSEDQIELGLEIAEKKKPFGLSRIKYVSGIYANMIRQTA